jgi:hypothetical protein
VDSRACGDLDSSRVSITPELAITLHYPNLLLLFDGQVGGRNYIEWQITILAIALSLLTAHKEFVDG